MTEPAPLTLTGERTLPGIWQENYWLRLHEAAYDVFAPMCAGARVLEAGCGEGYGAARLAAAGARTVVGVDSTYPPWCTCGRRTPRCPPCAPTSCCCPAPTPASTSS